MVDFEGNMFRTSFDKVGNMLGVLSLLKRLKRSAKESRILVLGLEKDHLFKGRAKSHLG
jgi:hypothetical protein